MLRRYAALALLVGLVSCNGAGTSVPVTQNAQSAPAGMGFSPALLPPMAPIRTEQGAIDGIDDRFVPPDGDTPTGGHGQTIDGKVPCLPTMGNAYHVHVFLGIVYRGQLMAVPDTIGMKEPGPEVDGFTNSAKCFYEIHTHDASGIVHLEVAEPHPLSSVVFKLKHVLDVWGVQHGEKSFGPFKGKIHVYVGNPTALGQTTVSAYAPFTGKHWTSIGLRSHEVIWIEIGKPYYNAAQLPPVTFYMEY
ncbi:MAG TPA: hypothetical protein VKB39_10950 [Candidatus Baltobacteraceae bacterium]|nr:hypothetical protein [Candidatus Baltobacteraceae bacterium]